MMLVKIPELTEERKQEITAGVIRGRELGAERLRAALPHVTESKRKKIMEDRLAELEDIAKTEEAIQMTIDSSNVRTVRKEQQRDGSIIQRTYEAWPGETKLLPEDLAKAWISRGWAEDPTGVIPTGEKQIGPVKLDVQSVLSRHNERKTGG